MAVSVTSLGASNISGDAWTRDGGNNYVEGRRINDIANYMLGVNKTYFNQPIRFADSVTDWSTYVSGMPRMNSNIYHG